LKALNEYGVCMQLLQSAKTRQEITPNDRLTLYSFTYHPKLPRVPGDIYITPMEATGRKQGPFLMTSYQKP
jgi:hypothetical protein